MFNTKGQETKKPGLNKSFEAGVVYAHIYDGWIRTAKTGKKALELILEGPALKDFEGWPVDRNNPEGAKYVGQTAKVMGTTYTDQYDQNSISRNEIMYKLTMIAEAAGVRKELDNISVDTLEQWAAEVINLVKGKNLYFFCKGTEEEYNGKTIVKLSLPKYKFVSDEENKLEKFDKTNQYHYRPLTTQKVSSFEPADDFNV